MPPTPETRGGRKKMGPASPSPRVGTAELPRGCHSLRQPQASAPALSSQLPQMWLQCRGPLPGRAGLGPGGCGARRPPLSSRPSCLRLAKGSWAPLVRAGVGTPVGFQDARRQSARTSRCTRASQAPVTLLWPRREPRAARAERVHRPAAGCAGRTTTQTLRFECAENVMTTQREKG